MKFRVNTESVFRMQQHHGAELAAIVLQIELSLDIRVFLDVLYYTVMPTDCRVGAELDIGVAFPADDHPVSFLKRDEVVDFGFFIVVFVDWVEDDVRFFELGELDQVVSLVV